jgi:hypothetical protein
MNTRILATLLICGAIVSGCATQAPTLNFVPQDVLPAKNKVNAELKSITISIAKEEERLGETQVGFMGNQYEASFRTSFKEAIEEAILKSAIFNDLAENKVSLTVKIMKFQTPGAGINFDTSMIVRYEVYNRKDGKLIFRRDIESAGSVAGDYAFMGAIRYTEARNVAGRNNIISLMSALEELKVSP